MSSTSSPIVPDVSIADKISAQTLPWFSFEFYPPKTPKGVENLYKRLGKMMSLKPQFVDLTWGAGGSTSELTVQMVTTFKERYGALANMHLTCTNMPTEMITAALDQIAAVGITNIVSLRGDPPAGQEKWEVSEGGFACALDLVKFIKSRSDDAVSQSVAGYPEGHPNVIKPVAAADVAALTLAEQGRLVTNAEGETFVCSDADFAGEIAYLKAKVDAGARIIITQMFFDADVFLAFVQACRDAGITIPILPGVMCITKFGGFQRMTGFCKSRVPKALWDSLVAVKDDDAEVFRIGTEHMAGVCRRLLESGAVPGLHFYCLNQEKPLLAMLKALEWVVEDASQPLGYAIVPGKVAQ
jgi:methylenetetrahydrofolate reductase (NADPH)|tara:strand:+ start:3066 stop:4133 length:1068 start_codon:yes stop_codon:yes gene_type:complete